jgi:hypothetical protein
MLIQKIDVRPRYIHVLCTGTIEIDGFVLALNRGLEAAASSGRKAVVMDALRVDGTLTRAERFVLGDNIAYAQRAHDCVAMIAVVSTVPPLASDRFAEKVAINRGAVGKSFTDLSDAERWIEDKLAEFTGGASPGGCS